MGRVRICDSLLLILTCPEFHVVLVVNMDYRFDTNAELMKVSCTNLGMPQGSDTTDEEIGMLYHAIQDVASSSHVDHRFILAVIMQESLGCVRVYTTANANANPGIMQDHAGSHTCNPATKGITDQMVFPCPAEQIQGMIEDGVGGTNFGDGLAAYLNTVVHRANAAGFAASGNNAQVYYQAARLYNSGSVDYMNLGRGYSSRNCYASDIANRLTGWIFASHQCSLDG